MSADLFGCVGASRQPGGCGGCNLRLFHPIVGYCRYISTRKRTSGMADHDRPQYGDRLSAKKEAGESDCGDSGLSADRGGFLRGAALRETWP